MFKTSFFRVRKMVPKTQILSLQFTIFSSFIQFLDVFVEIQQISASKEFSIFQQLKTKNKTPTDKRGTFRPQLLYYDIILRRKNFPNIEQTIRKKTCKKQVFKTVLNTPCLKHANSGYTTFRPMQFQPTAIST